MTTAYTTDFYDGQVDGSRTSADAIAALITDLVKPKSVIDVGCGTGTWLRAFRGLGAATVVGLDGDYVDRDVLEIAPEEFVPTDLSADWSFEGSFDLAISLEVAEHLPPTVGPQFARKLTELAPVVLFSAAIPFQGGTEHINERPQSYWVSEFRRLGYRALDPVRPALWLDDSVEPWYRQNVLLYVREGVEVDAAEATLLDVVHPRFIESSRTAPLTLKGVAQRLPATAGAARQRGGRLARRVLSR